MIWRAWVLIVVRTPGVCLEVIGIVDNAELTVGALLEEPLCSSVEPLAEDADRSAVVRWCLPLNEALAMESLTDVLVFAAPGHSVVDREILATLATRGASALLVTPDVPLAHDVIARAGHRPILLRTAKKLDYSQVSQLVAQKVLTRRAHALEYGVTIHERMADLLYRGGGLTAMSQQLSRLTGCAVILLDTHLETLAYESLSTRMVPDPSEVTRLVAEAIADGRLPQEHCEAVTITVELEQGSTVCVVCPIVLGGRIYGWLLLVELRYPPPHHELTQHLVGAQHGATLMGAELLRLHSVSEAEERARGDFIHALLHGRFTNSHELLARAEHHQFDVTASYGVVVGNGIPDLLDLVSSDRHRPNSMFAPIVGDRPWTVTTVIGDVFAVVRQVSKGKPKAAREAELAEFARELHRELDKYAMPELRVAYGRPGVGAAGIATSYRDARVTLGVARHIDYAPVCGYSELRVFATLSRLATSPEGADFARDVLTPLRSKSRGDDLERVVVSYVRNGGNLNGAARDLHMHRNTVLYKVNQAAELLDMDLRSAEDQFCIWLAHRLDLLASVEREVAREVDLA